MSTIVTTIDAELISFTQLFGHTIGGIVINEIEIPLIQRDYAQGRQTAKVDRIRSQFIEAVCAALLPDGAPIELDFVYGDVEGGKLMPLDGQQRLTFLFLLHSYLAWHQSLPVESHLWVKFSYATRPSAREFCKQLSGWQPFAEPSATITLSNWIKDQSEYLPTWEHDPSIQSMLVVLDALHTWFTRNSVDVKAAWIKLVDVDKPAIRFHLLPMMAHKTHEQYIKMNSRGKPLTPFENFKAQFEEMLKIAHPTKADDFAKKIDTTWTDTLWAYRGDDNLVDDEFMRYFRFVSEVCVWSGKDSLTGSKKINDVGYLGELAEKVYGTDQPKSKENLDFLFHAFDIWHGKTIKGEFEAILTPTVDTLAHKVRIFNPFKKEGIDLFDACCRHYGTEEWDLARTLLFYGVLLRHGFPKQETEVTDFSQRLRILRNLLEGSRGGEIREEFMPELLADVRHVMLGNLASVSKFNQEQKQNEVDKLALLATDPTLATILYQLEDHDLLRGGLTAFDLEASKFQSRAETFLQIFNRSAYVGNKPWIDITGALLAHGDYAKIQKRSTRYHFVYLGAPSSAEPWRRLFRGKGKGALCRPLMALLDELKTGSTLQDEIQSYLDNPATVKDWRYYFVKYPVMRQGDSGLYTFDTNGYEVCMLKKDQMNSYYADPYLYAATKKSVISNNVIANPQWPYAFYGYENKPRWLQLKNSGIKLRSVDAGWEIKDIPPAHNVEWETVIDTIAIRHLTVTEPTGATALISISKIGAVDAEDRVEIAAKLLETLVAKGF